MKQILKFNSILIIVLILTYFYMFWSYKSNNITRSKPIINYTFDIQETYRNKCINLYKKIRYPDSNLIYRPPLREPPSDLMNAFTQNGKMPIKNYLYFNEVYEDSDQKKNVTNKIFDETDLDEWIDKIRKNKPLRYGDLSLKELMFIFSPLLKQKSVAVVGTVDIWIEALAFEIGCSKITTLEYTRNSYALPKMEWFHVNDYLEKSIREKEFENYDNAVSFSSIEHSGLGRFGDPLSPYGDVDAVKQVHCMLKPGGLFFLAVPTSSDDSSYIEFNAHRVYGTSRLNLLFDGWKLLASKKDTKDLQTIFVLQKILT